MKKSFSKKLIFVIACALACVVLSSCGTPEGNFVAAIDRFDDTKAVTCTFENEVGVTINGETYENTFSGTTLINNKKEQFQVTGSAKTTYSGGEISYDINTIYDDDYLYSSTSGTGYKEKISYDDAVKTLIGYIALHGVNEGGFASIEETSEAGNMRYAFTFSEQGAYEITGLKEQLAKILNQVGEEGSLTIKNVSGTIALDNRKRPESQSVTIEAEMTSGEETIEISETLHTTFEMSGSSFEINAPEDGENYILLEEE